MAGVGVDASLVSWGQVIFGSVSMFVSASMLVWQGGRLREQLSNLRDEVSAVREDLRAQDSRVLAVETSVAHLKGRLAK